MLPAMGQDSRLDRGAENPGPGEPKNRITELFKIQLSLHHHPLVPRFWLLDLPIVNLSSHMCCLQSILAIVDSQKGVPRDSYR